jgi:hypothetical protein
MVSVPPFSWTQVVNLEYRMDATVATADDPPIVLGRMPDAWIQVWAALQPQIVSRLQLNNIMHQLHCLIGGGGHWLLP